MANKVYNATEAAVTFKASGGTVVGTFDNITTANGRQSARWDRGAGSLASLYRWRGVFQANATATVGNSVALYLAQSDGTIMDGTLGTADAALASAAKVRNLYPLGVVQADVTTLGTDYIASGLVEIYERYVVIAMFNNLGVTTHATANRNYVILTPVPPEIQ